MRPWKSFIGSVSVVTLLTAGAFAAGSDVMPFSHASRTTSPDVVVEDEAPAVDDDAPVVEPADEVVDEETTTTTDTPDAGTPDAGTPDTDTPDTDSDVPDIAAEDDAAPLPTVVEVPTRARPDKVVTRLPRPADDCPGSKPKGDHNNDGHCDNGWHNKDADWPADKGARPEAVRSAGKAKGDHNCDGHLDNGWHNKERPVCPVPAAPAERPAPAPKPEKGDRPDTAPGQVRKNR